MTIQATRIVITCRFWHTFRSTSRENGSTILWGALCPNSFTRATAGNCWNERPWDYFCCGTKFSGRSQGSRCTPCSPPSCRGFPVPTKDLVWLPSLLWLLTIRWVHTKGGYRVRGKMWTIQSTKWFSHLTSLLSFWLFLSDLVQVAHPCYPSCLSVPDQTSQNPGNRSSWNFQGTIGLVPGMHISEMGRLVQCLAYKSCHDIQKCVFLNFSKQKPSNGVCLYRMFKSNLKQHIDKLHACIRNQVCEKCV